MNDLLVHNPGSYRISSNSIQVNDGAIMSVLPPSGGVTPNSASGSCAALDLCLFQNSNFGGYMISFFYCRSENLNNYYMGNGSSWANQTSSIDNPQSSGTVSWFYHDGSTLFSLGGGHYLKNLASNPGPHNGSMNDWITSVQVC